MQFLKNMELQLSLWRYFRNLNMLCIQTCRVRNAHCIGNWKTMAIVENILASSYRNHWNTEILKQMFVKNASSICPLAERPLAYRPFGANDHRITWKYDRCVSFEFELRIRFERKYPAVCRISVKKPCLKLKVQVWTEWKIKFYSKIVRSSRSQRLPRICISRLVVVTEKRFLNVVLARTLLHCEILQSERSDKTNVSRAPPYHNLWFYFLVTVNVRIESALVYQRNVYESKSPCVAPHLTNEINKQTQYHTLITFRDPERLFFCFVCVSFFRSLSLFLSLTAHTVWPTNICLFCPLQNHFFPTPCVAQALPHTCSLKHSCKTPHLREKKTIWFEENTEFCKIRRQLDISWISSRNLCKLNRIADLKKI